MDTYTWRRNGGQRADSREFPRLPAMPLVKALLRVIERDMPFASQDHACSVYGVEARTFREWQSGRRRSVTFDTADRILCRTGLLWWEVWGLDNETAERAFTGEVRHA
jgi:hypothetical protein